MLSTKTYHGDSTSNYIKCSILEWLFGCIYKSNIDDDYMSADHNRYLSYSINDSGMALSGGDEDSFYWYNDN